MIKSPSLIRARRILFTVWLLALVFNVVGATQAIAQTDVVGRWSSVPDLPFFPVHSHLLPNGKVMIWPGDEGISGNDPRAWDPATATTDFLAKPGYDVFCSGHSFLPDGRLLIAGGHIQNGVGLPNSSIYDPFSDTWSHMPNMNAGRWYPTTATLANGDVLVVSGSIDNTLGENRLPQVFQTSSGTWRSLTNAQIGLDLYPRIHLGPNGRVISVAPSTTTRYLDTSGTGAWSVVGNHSVNVYRDYGSSVMYDDGKILVMGGGSPPTSTAEVIDLNAGSPAWRSVASMAFARRQLNATVLPDGQVLVTGGTSGPGFNDATSPVFAAEMWNPATESWTTMASAQIPRLYHSTALLLPDGRILSMGGNGFPQTEIYEPPYLFKGTRPAISSAPAGVNYGQTFFVQTADAASISKVTWIRLSSVTHGFNMDQRFSQLNFSQSAGGLNVVAPSSPNLSPPGYYLLFVLNANGVPSVAKIVRIDSSVTAPALTSLSPSSATAGGPAFTLTVNGSNFVSGSVVQWNGAARSTTFVSATQLTAAIPASDIAAAGTAQVTVANPGGGTSNALTFTINTTGPTACTVGQYFAQYYNNITLSGSPTFSACEGSINYDWGTGGPGNGVNVDNFSVRWTGRFNFAAGTYTFTARADDGIRVWVDGTQIIDAWIDQAPTTYQATRTLTAGEHEVRVEYYERGGGAVAQVSWQATAGSAPALTSLSPNSATAGGPAFTLTVNGSNFVSGSVVQWNGAARTTTFVSATQLTAAIPASDIAAAGTAQVRVVNPDGGTSNALTFTINPGTSAPSLTTLSPSSATAGGPAFTLTVNGSNFVSGSVVQWNGAARTTTFVSATQLTAAISAGDIATAGTAQVRVVNPDGGTSNPLTFTITAPGFTLTIIRSGNGTVTSTPIGINCGSACAAAYSPGTVVTLTATPQNRNFRFIGWSGGGCSGTGQCTLTMDANKQVTATFGRN